MTTCSFKVGTLLEMEGRRFEILRISEGGHLYLEATDDGEVIARSKEGLLELFSVDKLRFVREHSQDGQSQHDRRHRTGRPLSTYSDAIQSRAIRKKRYLELLETLGPIVWTPEVLSPKILACARELKDPNPPSANTIYRWAKRLSAAGGDPRALIDRFESCGRKTRLPARVFELLRQTIETEYLVPEKRTAQDVYYALLRKLEQENEFQPASEHLPMPSLSTVHRHVRAVDSFDVAVAKHGVRLAKIKFRTSGQGPITQRILERVEIDHTPLDLFVIDDKTQLPLGRPCVTVALDKYSRMVVGMHVGFDGPSVRAVLRCLRHSILPKSYVKERYPEVEHDWPCYGQISELVCDNGLEFHSTELARVAFELGMTLVFCPKRQPWMKGSIERYLKTLNYQFAHSMPGTSMAKWFQREDYDPLREALVTHEQLLGVLHKWLIDVYSQTAHKGVGETPYHRWTESARRNTQTLPESATAIDVTVGDSHTRVLSHQGIEFGGLKYNDHVLAGIRRKFGERVQVDIIAYFDDVSKISVIDPDTREAISVPATDQSYADGLTREQHRLLCARAREINSGSIDHSALARAKAEIRSLVGEFALSRHQRKRQRGAKIRGIGAGTTDPLDGFSADSAAATKSKQSPNMAVPVASKAIDELPILAGTLIDFRVAGRKT